MSHFLSFSVTDEAGRRNVTHTDFEDLEDVIFFFFDKPGSWSQIDWAAFQITENFEKFNKETVTKKWASSCMAHANHLRGYLHNSKSIRVCAWNELKWQGNSCPGPDDLRVTDEMLWGGGALPYPSLEPRPSSPPDLQPLGRPLWVVDPVAMRAWVRGYTLSPTSLQKKKRKTILKKWSRQTVASRSL